MTSTNYTDFWHRIGDKHCYLGRRLTCYFLHKPSSFGTYTIILTCTFSRYKARNGWLELSKWKNECLFSAAPRQTNQSRSSPVNCKRDTFVCFWRDSPPSQWATASSFMRFLDHAQRRTTVGRTPLDE